MPVTWGEIAQALKRRNSEALYFTPSLAIKRLERLGDLFAPALTLKQELPEMFTKALASGPQPKLSSWPRTRGKTGHKDPDRVPSQSVAKPGDSRKAAPTAKMAAKVAEPAAPPAVVETKPRDWDRPKFVPPMRCRAVAELPESDKWTFELKFDGYRCLAVKEGDKVTLYSRNEKILDERFPGVRSALGGVAGDFVVDGEIVALDKEGRPSFQQLQKSRRKTPTFFYAFDLINHQGADLRRLPIEERRDRLGALWGSVGDPLRLSTVLRAPSHEILEAVRNLGLEGVVGKRRGSLYEAGERTGAWIKRRSNREQEFVIGGYVPGTRGFESLLLGVYESGSLIYVAKVKDGFVPRLRLDIFPFLERLRQETCPFSNLPEKKTSSWGESLTSDKMKACRWIKPELVCQVAFLEWTDGGKLRHCSFVAMRDDKVPREVAREVEAREKDLR